MKSESPDKNQTYQPLSILLNELELACDEEKTGRFYIVTAENHAAYLDLEHGIITAVKYRLTKGESAIELLCKAHWLRFSFDENCKVTHDEPALPNTFVILHKLENALEELRVIERATELQADHSALGRDRLGRFVGDEPRDVDDAAEAPVRVDHRILALGDGL